eukprot:1143209-Pelagomonas_calceolata.AAC.1
MAAVLVMDVLNQPAVKGTATLNCFSDFTNTDGGFDFCTLPRQRTCKLLSAFIGKQCCLTEPYLFAASTCVHAAAFAFWSGREKSGCSEPLTLPLLAFNCQAALASLHIMTLHLLAFVHYLAAHSNEVVTLHLLSCRGQAAPH